MSAPTARGPLFYIGAAALLGAMAVDATAVLGRHVGLPLLGSLELVQAAILLASSAALVAATLERRHAAARLVLDRVSPFARRVMQRFNAVLTVLFFTILGIGQTWIAADLWREHESSELLHIPYAPLRIVSIVAMLLAAVTVARQLIRGQPP